MLTIRKSQDRGTADHGWLLSRHTFSFGEYFDPEHMGFSTLRVINEDRVDPAQGFGTHGHQDMEIISYVVTGALEHKDSIGTGSVIRPGDVQIMSAGTGIRHSEFNHSKSEPVHFLQIWIEPNRKGVPPRYEQTKFPDDSKRGRLVAIGSPDGRNGSVVIYQDAELYASLLDEGQTVVHELEPKRKAWLQMIRGALEVNGQGLEAGDGVAIEQERGISMVARADGTEFLLFDLP